MVREWVSEWVSVLRPMANSYGHTKTRTLVWSMYIVFATRFSLFFFRFSLFDPKSNFKFLMVREWVSEWVTVLRPTNSYGHTKTRTLFLSMFIVFAFRFSFFAFRFSIIGHVLSC